LELVYKSVKEYLDAKFQTGITDQVLMSYFGLSEDFSRSLLPELNGTVLSNMFESSANGDWTTVQGVKLNSGDSASRLATTLIETWDKSKVTQQKIHGFDASLFDNRAAIANVDDWVLMSNKSGLTDYLNALTSGVKQAIDFGEHVQYVQKHFAHRHQPFFVMALSPKFWHRWTFQINEWRSQMLKDKSHTRDEKIEFAKAEIQMAFWELVGFQVLVGSNREQGIQFSGVVFQPGK
jgi:hypothetical protein